MSQLSRFIVHKNCKFCNGLGYIEKAVGSYSKAKLCEPCAKNCPICKGRGFEVKKDSKGCLFHHQCSCQKIRHRIDRFNSAEIPNRYVSSSLQNFNSPTERSMQYQALLQSIQAYPLEQKGFFFSGSSGTGKTHLLVGILKYLTLEKGVPCMYKQFSELLIDLREAHRVGKTENEIIENLANIDVLCLDDIVHCRYFLEWEQSVFEEIIGFRYRRSKLTFMASSYPLDTSDDNSIPQEKEQTSRSGYRLSWGTNNWGANKDLSSISSKPTVLQFLGEYAYYRIKEMCSFYRLHKN